MSRTLFAIGLLGSCCVAAGARADGFSWDLSGAVSQAEVGSLQDADGSALSASHYFAPVDDSRGPYGLAAFLNPTSRISAAVSHQKVTYHPINISTFPPGATVSDSSITTDDYTIGGRYVLPASKWYAGGDYTMSNIDSSFSFDTKAYRVLAGKYLGQRTSLELAMNRSVLEFPAINVNTKSVTEHVSLSFLHVRGGESFTYSLFGGVGQTNRHTDLAGPAGTSFADSFPRYWTYSFGTELFPTTKLGFRVGYTRVDDPVRDDSYDVAATWFLKRNIGIQLAWSQTQYDATSAPRSDTTNLRFVGRF
ncbi:MAG TPA: putative porin [Gammaproteobacteria bacterium]|nr:putative porin [Gammaproteobacteria bacterium]